MQINLQTNEVSGAEDCLYLNVFAPAEAIEQSSTGNFSVMVYIMGEAFQSGSAQQYGPDFLIEKDVIVVGVLWNCAASFVFQLAVAFGRLRSAIA